MVYVVSLAIMYTGGWLYYVMDYASWMAEEMERPPSESRVSGGFPEVLKQYPFVVAGITALVIAAVWPVKAYRDACRQVRVWKTKYEVWRMKRSMSHLDETREMCLDELASRLEIERSRLEELKNETDHTDSAVSH